MKYSIIIPVYNRPDEVDELLQSLTTQTFKDFEVVVVEDGSDIPCQEVVEKYADRLNLKYFNKPNSGPGQTRNYGVERSQGEFVIVLDSDVVLPPSYLDATEQALTQRGSGEGAPIDAWGGPDRAHESFSDVQKAINYSMTSFFTTGGIRGGKKQMDKKFYPRSFNMGIRRSLYQQLGGFSEMRFGEDIDFSIRIYESGACCRLFPEAWVWHKRRTDFKKFFKQVHNSGIARINLMKRHPGTLKLVHLLPAVFTLGTFACLLMALLFLILTVLGFIALWSAPKPGCVTGPMVCIIFGIGGMLLFLLPLILFSIIIFMDSSFRNKSVKIGFLSIWASFIQLIGYGTGFLRAWWLRCVCGRNEELQAFKNNFYK
ncbi:MAG: glycosyltransferase [Bacteroidaceae bacterium]|nr:glycosyltransferase [Bacteroidaceae bacterium]